MKNPLSHKDKLCVYVDLLEASSLAESTVRFLQRFATEPVKIRLLETESLPGQQPVSRLLSLIHLYQLSHPFLYLQAGTRLSVGWDQSFRRIFRLHPSRPFVAFPQPFTELVEPTALADLRENEETFLSRLWTRSCTGLVTPTLSSKLNCVGLGTGALKCLRLFQGPSGKTSLPEEEVLGQLDWLLLLDVLALPFAPKKEQAPSISRSQKEEAKAPYRVPFRVVEQPPSRKGSPTLGLCMIVKNEAAHLERCIRSVAPIIDQAVVVDTGSDDETPSLARRLGAQVIETSWPGDFACARNIGLDAIKTDWVLILDADEEIAALDLRQLQSLTQDPTAWAYKFTARSYYWRNEHYMHWTPNDGQYTQGNPFPGWIPSTTVRLFRNDPRIRYQGQVHELVEWNLWKYLLPEAASPIPIHHYGMLQSPYARKKNNHYIQLGQKKAESFHLDRAKALFELASSLTGTEQYQAAVECYLECIHTNRLFVNPYLALGGTLLLLEEYQAAVAVYSYVAQSATSESIILPALREAQRHLQQKGHKKKKMLHKITEALPSTPPWQALRTVALDPSLWLENWNLARQLEQTGNENGNSHKSNNHRGVILV